MLGYEERNASFFQAGDIPFEKIQTVTDVLQDQEAFDNDQLRYMKYEKQGPSSPYGEEEDYVITTMPFRLDSIGDPVLRRSRPTGYDTRRILNDYGYDDATVDKLVEDGAVMCYTGDPLPASVLEPSYGPNSKRD